MSTDPAEGTRNYSASFLTDPAEHGFPAKLAASFLENAAERGALANVLVSISTGLSEHGALPNFSASGAPANFLARNVDT